MTLVVICKTSGSHHGLALVVVNLGRLLEKAYPILSP